MKLTLVLADMICTVLIFVAFGQSALSLVLSVALFIVTVMLASGSTASSR